jgi:ribonuclease E
VNADAHESYDAQREERSGNSRNRRNRRGRGGRDRNESRNDSRETNPDAPAAFVPNADVIHDVAAWDAISSPASSHAPVPAPEAKPAQTVQATADLFANAAPASTVPAASMVKEAAAVAPAMTVAVATPAPSTATTPAPKVAVQDLMPVLQQAGLQMVQTDSKKAAEIIPVEVPKTPRAVRERKPLPPLEAAPLQMVETGK